MMYGNPWVHLHNLFSRARVLHCLWLRCGKPWVLLYSVWREPSIYEAGPEFIAWTRERSWGFTARGIYLIPSHIQYMLYMYKLNLAWRKSDTRFSTSGFFMHQFPPGTWVSQSGHLEFLRKFAEILATLCLSPVLFTGDKLFTDVNDTGDKLSVHCFY